MKQYTKPALNLIDIDIKDILLASGDSGLTVDPGAGDVSGDPIIFANTPVDIFGE